MNPSRVRPSRILLLAVLFAVGRESSRAIPPFTRDFADSNSITAVSSEVSNDYVRAKLPNGSFQPETYAFAKGGYYGSTMSDDTIDNEGFIDLARAVARPLAVHGYIPSKDPGKVKLLIVVYWGATSGTSDPSSKNYLFTNAMEAEQHKGASSDMTSQVRYQPGQNDIRNTSNGGYAAELSVNSPQVGQIFQGGMINSRNAAILGYASEIAATPPKLGLIHNVKREDLIDDIEHNRYFVVLMAYDFQAIRNEKRPKLLWVTRFSIREQGNDFEKMLPAMAMYASQYFGQDTHGLIRDQLPEGKVNIGEPTLVAGPPERNEAISESTLIADAGNLSKNSHATAPQVSPLPSDLAVHIAAYRRGKAALQDALAAKIKSQATGEDTRRAIDAFNAENSASIAALNRDAETIRGELARYAASNAHGAGEQSTDSLARQFNSSVQSMEVAEPLLARPDASDATASPHALPTKTE
ncbi:MAG TPA: hypothetical protein VII09_01570 [Opitutaceae bacterium]